MDDTDHTIHGCIMALFELCEQAVGELVKLTNIEYSYDIKTVGGGRRLIDDMRDSGYTIYEVYANTPFKRTYILQLNGKQIARRDVCLEVTVE
ncbi:MAG: hypothetical protein ACT6FG_00260 [Methanosarcinaceae archaeon]